MRAIHRLFKLSMVFRLKKPSLIKFDMVSSLINEPSELIQLYTLVVYPLWTNPCRKIFKIKWVSPQAKFLLEINQGPRWTSTKKMHDMQRRHRSPFKDHCEYIVRYLFVMLCCFILALFELFWKEKKMVNNLFKINLSLERKKNNNEINDGKHFGIHAIWIFWIWTFLKAWMWTTNPNKVLYAYLEYLLSTNLLQEWKKGERNKDRNT